MAKRKPVKKVDKWVDSEDYHRTYLFAKAGAQAAANADGYDRGLECNPLMKEWMVYMLPRRENRYGHELRCEVVMCEDLSKCQPGHGPGK